MALEITKEIKEDFEEFCKKEFKDCLYISNKNNDEQWLYVQVSKDLPLRRICWNEFSMIHMVNKNRSVFWITNDFCHKFSEITIYFAYAKRKTFKFSKLATLCAVGLWQFNFTYKLFWFYQNLFIKKMLGNSYKID